MYNIMTKAFILATLLASFTERVLKGCPGGGTCPPDVPNCHDHTDPIFIQARGAMRNEFHKKSKYFFRIDNTSRLQRF